MNPSKEYSYNQSIGFMLFSLLCFTANALLVRTILDISTLSPWLILCIRFGVATILAFTLLAPLGKPKFQRLFKRPLVAIRGILGGSAMLLFYLSIPHIGIGHSVIITSTYTLFSILLACIFLKESFGLPKVFWMLIAGTGVLLVTGALNAQDSYNALTLYDILAVGSAFIGGIAVIIIKILIRTESSGTIFASQAFYGFLMTSFSLTQISSVSYQAFLLMVLAGSCAALAQLTMTIAYKKLTVNTGASIQLTGPVFVSLGGAMLFGELFLLPDILGCVLALFGCFMLIRNKPQ